MSLLTKVLKDVEKRRQQKQAETSEAPLASGAKNRLKLTQAMPKSLSLLLWLLIFIAMVGVAYYAFQKINIIQPVLRSSQQAVAINKASVAKDAQVADLEWKDNNAESGELRLTLDKSMPYQLIRGSDHQHFTLVLNHTQLAKTLQQPTVTDSPLISQLAVNTKDNQVTIDLYLKQKVSIHAVEHSTDKVTMLSVTLNALSLPTITQVVQPAPLSKEEMLAQSYQNILNIAQSGDIEKALQDLQELAKAHPENKDLVYTQGVLLYRQHQYAKASKLVQAALNQQPDNLKLVTLQARLALAQGHTKDALTLLLSYNPPLANHEDFYSLLAAAERLSGNMAMAAGYYAELLKVDPNQSLWWLGYAVTEESQHNFNAAIKAYQQALATGNLAPSLQVYVSNRLGQLQSR